jgi:hypothetical protein
MMPSASGTFGAVTIVDEHVEKWTAWIEGPIRNDIIGMHHKRQIWRQLGDMLTKNPRVANTPSTLWDWMGETYTTTQAIGIRRQADRDPRTCSLARLIEEMRDDAPRLTRAHFLSLWDQQHDEWMMRRAEKAFDALAGAADNISTLGCRKPTCRACAPMRPRWPVTSTSTSRTTWPNRPSSSYQA